MTWVAELEKIRRYLRDPNGNIWSEAFLKNLYNAVQREIQERTNILEDVSAVRVPPYYQYTYLHDWEWANLPTTESQFYQALRYHQQANIICCFQWEAQATNEIDASITDVGDQFTQVWEAFHITPGQEVRFRFPKNFHTMHGMFYDYDPVEFTTKKNITSCDPSYLTRTGDTQYYFRSDELDNSFVPYPLPSVKFADDIISSPEEGMALFQSGDTVSAEDGDIQKRTASIFSDFTGISVDIIEAADNFVLIYRAIPTDIVSQNDESDFPEFLRKYIRYGVLHRAYKANTDGRIPSLEEYWGFRYELGVKFIQMFHMKRKADRDYRLTHVDPIKRTRRHPRLPDGYPA